MVAVARPIRLLVDHAAAISALELVTLRHATSVLRLGIGPLTGQTLG